MPNDTATAPVTFDLTTSPWLPVLRTDGTEDELSLTEVFAQAADLRRLVGDVPTQEFALLRLLLAVLHDALDGPSDLDEWEDLWREGIPADTVAAYLHDHRERFDLFHPAAPFFQVADLRTGKDEYSSPDPIVADVPNNARFFTMRALGAATLTFAEAARWLVHAHAYDTSGIKSGAVGDPRLKSGKVYPQGVGWAGNLGGVHVEGDTLRETLLLNLVAFDTDGLRWDPDFDTEPDLPAWRLPPDTSAPLAGTAAVSRPHGLRDLYTWQTRRLRLHHDGESVNGVLLAYGNPLTPHNKHDREPMTAWRRSPAQEKKLKQATVYLPRDHDPSRAAWRGLGALVTGEVRGAEQRHEAAAIVRPRILDWFHRLAVHGPFEPSTLIRVRLAGAVYGTQQSVIDEIVDDAVALPIVLLGERDADLGRMAVDAVADAENAVTVLGDLATDLARAEGREPDPPRSTARDQGFAALDGRFRAWLCALRSSDDPGYPAEERRRWQAEVHRIVSDLGGDLVRASGEAAWQGRVVHTAKGDLWLNASRADLRFRSGLRKALTMAAPEDAADSKTPDGTGDDD
ncbi:type I-E CRISPR-associated protein Cse1/CasA [Nocardiopsis changdeensis]|uniref:Type I-E CRISPR-associated protein Cse1/CasA n=1 Tax=Nocardiopsis changdeensis TaxID=2831969 RepID=A0ABX8BFS6_9ACTN|nr:MULTISPECIES: type I-E CRISPR-associated protein Cse1/CasA [Nocardiopsis]QUX21094.1 type I-E CRISPR-associated protein Cse1/CasA [Nocardiopsis changdeensis]QYX37024.1 type I-E CRISPR-associated protein Cse1/CasA [Nocardiopsis sp. MT53]